MCIRDSHHHVANALGGNLPFHAGIGALLDARGHRVNLLHGHRKFLAGMKDVYKRQVS